MSSPSESYLVGLIGEGVTPSLTPPMHEQEAGQLGLRYLYRPVDLSTLVPVDGDDGGPGDTAAQLRELLHRGRDLGFNAFNITHPCKQLVLQFLDEVSDDAARLGAVNTVLIRDGKFVGHNTDFSGFTTALAAGLPSAALDSVVQLGVGGAGAAVAYALLKAGAAELTLIDLDPARAQERAEALGRLFPEALVTAAPAAGLPAALAEADGLVHATPVGMHSHPGLPLDLDLISPDQWVADVVYRPLETELVLGARAKGCAVLDGGYMAVGQAVDAFELITGIRPDARRMREHFLDLIARGL
ncbi:shikimate dehydrogenase [Arthrobacter sp. zg-ZUI100]|uniref:shikimate dehydrogenase n=1 Tax=Arthrobacter jiangjiafuii TaxID=2817475 RepID=UPI001AEE012A|nr:shikimate dehydrogenase [Arthrobacter jiangjiafuii]